MSKRDQVRHRNYSHFAFNCVTPITSCSSFLVLPRSTIAEEETRRGDNNGSRWKTPTLLGGQNCIIASARASTFLWGCS